MEPDHIQLVMGIGSVHPVSTEFRKTTGPRLRDPASWPPLAAAARSRNLGSILPRISVDEGDKMRLKSQELVSGGGGGISLYSPVLRSPFYYIAPISRFCLRPPRITSSASSLSDRPSERARERATHDMTNRFRVWSEACPMIFQSFS